MKNYRILLSLSLCLMLSLCTWAAKVKTKAAPGETKVVGGVTVKALFLSDNIVRIVKYPGQGAMPEKKSYSVRQHRREHWLGDLQGPRWQSPVAGIRQSPV